MQNFDSIETAMTLAKIKNVLEDNNTLISFRINRELLSLVKEIIEKNGTDLSSFLRECLTLLLCEYNPDFKTWYIHINELNKHFNSLNT